MKKIILSLIAAGTAGFLAAAQAQNDQPADDNTNAPAGAAANNQPPADQPPPPDMQNGLDSGGQPAEATQGDNAMQGTDTTQASDNATSDDNQPKGSEVITPSRDSHRANGEVSSSFMPPETGTNVNDINLHFNRAPLEMVLNYLSDAAGFIIVQETRINSGVTVTVNGKHLTQDEAADLLNSVLNQNGYAAIRDNRTLTIVDKTDAKTREIPVRTSNNPKDIPKNAEIVTEIIPIRFVEAQQLVSDLSSFVSPQATVVANSAGNSIIITDTQQNIHHLTEIIKAIDDSAEAETEIRVFHLQYANPNDVATELGNVFPSSTSGNTSQSPIRFGGAGGPGGFAGRFGGLFGGGGFGGGGAAGAASGSGSSADRIRKATQVTAVADPRIQSVIVTAPKDMMDEIANMMKDLDVPSDRDQNVYVFNMKNGDPQQVAQVLQNMFQTSSSRGGASSSSTTSTDPLATRVQNSTSQMSSQSSSFGSSSGVGGGRSGGGAGGF